MKCATCALTVTASGKMITPLFVFKSKNLQLIVGMMKCFSHFIVLDRILTYGTLLDVLW